MPTGLAVFGHVDGVLFSADNAPSDLVGKPFPALGELDVLAFAGEGLAA